MAGLIKYRIKEYTYEKPRNTVTPEFASEFAVEIRVFFIYWKFIKSFRTLETAKIFLSDFKSSRERNEKVVYSE